MPISGCGPTCLCVRPATVAGPRGESSALAREVGDIVYTACVPREPRPSSSSSSSSSSSQQTGSSSSSNSLLSQVRHSTSSLAESVDTVLIDVPNEATGKHQRFQIEVRGGFDVFPTSGWTITLLKLATPQTDVEVVPPTLPADSMAEGGALFGFTFNEVDGVHQYWVPVLESIPFAAALRAKEWTVVILKEFT